MAKDSKPPAAAKPEPQRDIVGDVVDPATPVRAVPLGEDRWQLKEHRNPGHWVGVHAGTTIDQLLDSAFWANVARKLKPRSTIEVHWDDATQFAELYVVDCGSNWASVSVLRHVEVKATAPQHLTQLYDIAYNGVVEQFRIMRLGDRAIIKSGFATEAAALAYLADYKRKLAA